MSIDPKYDASLAEALLREPPVELDRPRRLRAYPIWARLVVSVFLLAHVGAVVLYNTSLRGPLAELRKSAERNFGVSRYLRATGSVQLWSMFAPDPSLWDRFVKVLVEDHEGNVWDMREEPFHRRRHPYLFYSRRGKLQSRMTHDPGARKAFAGWVCRDWERRNGGEPAKEVRFVHLFRRIPDPDTAMATRLVPDELTERELESWPCDTTVHAQLPPRLRERYGLPPAPEGSFVEEPVRTWYDRKIDNSVPPDPRRGRRIP